MSGGSYNYFCYKVEEFTDSLKCHTPLREAFRVHMQLISDACHAIEWVDSCDYGEGDEEDAIRACLQDDAEIGAAIGMAVEAMQKLEAAINVAKALGEGAGE
jgi:hypothetical protein